MTNSEGTRTRGDDREQARARIKAAALDCFSQKGLAGTTMAAIARAAGLSPGALYLHFSSKQELFDSLGRPDLDQPSVRLRERRRQILMAALKVFGEKGYAAATMDEIAAAVGLSKAALYWHFAHKSGLFIGVLRDTELAETMEAQWRCEQHESLRRRMRRKMSSGDAHDFLVELGTSYLEAHSDPQHVELVRFALCEGMRDATVATMIFERVLERTTARLAEHLSKFGLGRADELREASGMFMGMLFAWVMRTHVLAHPLEGPEQPARDARHGKRAGQRGLDHEAYTAVAERMVQLFLHGLSGNRSATRSAKRVTKGKT
jgi:AcrR family transcriptional regulator